MWHEKRRQILYHLRQRTGRRCDVLEKRSPLLNLFRILGEGPRQRIRQFHRDVCLPSRKSGGNNPDFAQAAFTWKDMVLRPKQPVNGREWKLPFR